MFRRREDGSDDMMNETSEQNATTASAPSAPSITTPANPSAPAAAMPSMPSQPSPAFRPAPPQAAMAAANRASSMPTSAAAPALAESRSPATPLTPSARNSKRVLTVGPDIQMKGEIMSCDRVVIEGMVDATMRDVHTVELAETGALKGTAEVEDAEISGAFEGDLTVRGKLTIHSSGRVRGNVTYGEIEIERGGQISGNVRNVADAKTASNAPSKKAA